MSHRRLVIIALSLAAASLAAMLVLVRASQGDASDRPSAGLTTRAVDPSSVAPPQAERSEDYAALRAQLRKVQGQLDALLAERRRGANAGPRQVAAPAPVDSRRPLSFPAREDVPIPPAARRFAEAPEDKRWARGAASRISKLLEALQEPGVVVEDVACKGTVCRARLGGPEPSIEAQERLRSALEGSDLRFTQMSGVHKPGADGAITSVHSLFFDRLPDEGGGPAAQP